MLLFSAGDRLLLMVQTDNRRPLFRRFGLGLPDQQKASHPLPFVRVEGPCIAFLSNFCQWKEAKTLNVFVIMYVFIVVGAFFFLALKIHWVLWGFGIFFSGCHRVSLHSLVGCIAKCNGFLRTLLIVTFVFRAVGLYVLKFMGLLNPVWNAEKRTCD